MEAQLKELWQKIAPLLRLHKDIHIAGCVSESDRVEAGGLPGGAAPAGGAGRRVGLVLGENRSVPGHLLSCHAQSKHHPAVVAEVFVHELGHCAEGMILNDAYASSQVPSWVLEGFPEWMVGKITGRFSTSGWWTRYLTGNPSTLTAQSYGAMGFWWELDYLGVDVWTQGR